MPGKAELRILRVNLAHNAIACDLGDDAGCGDREGLAISLDDGVLGDGEIPHWQAINKAVVRGRGQSFHRAAHGEMGGTQDVEKVDFFGIRRGHRPLHGRVFGEAVKNFLAALGAQFLGVVEARAGIAAWQDDGSSCHRAGQRAAAGFVHARNAAQAAGVEREFQ